MKLKPFEKLLVNIEGFLSKPDVVKFEGQWMPNLYDAWTYRARVVFAVGVKPTTFRVLQQAGDRSPTPPRFVGHVILESDTFFLSDEPNTKVYHYHKQVEKLAQYLVDHGMYKDIVYPPPYYELTDERFAETLKQTESRQ